MKKITLLIDDDVYKSVKSDVTVYNLAHAGGTTLIMQFLSKMISEIDKGNDKYHFIFKPKRKEKP
jgi:hypothetical protein